MKDETAYPGMLILAAGVVHGTVIPEYLSEWWGYGFFFMLAALAQLMYGLLLLMRPWAYGEDGGLRRQPAVYARPIYLAGAAGNLAVLCLYLVTRLAGIPFFGPGAGEVEPFTAPGIAVSLMEAVLAVALLALAWRSEPGVARSLSQHER